MFLIWDDRLEKTIMINAKEKAKKSIKKFKKKKKKKRHRIRGISQKGILNKKTMYCGMFRMADRVPVAVPVRPGCHQSPWKCLVVRRRIQRRLSRVRPVVNQTMYCLCLLPYIYLWFADFGTGGCICIALNRDRHHQICRSLSVLCSRYVGKGVTLYLGV